MKLQLDTEDKTIKVEGRVKLTELYDKLKAILPDWQEYSLICNTTIYNWTTPVYIDRYIPSYPYPWTVIGTTTGTFKYATDRTTTSVYNIEI